VGIADIHAGALSIYPNPATDMITVKMNGNHNFPMSYTMTDPEGRTVQSGTLELSTTIHISGLASGVYLLHIGGSVSKVVKE
jgi:hypothetical protein